MLFWFKYEMLYCESTLQKDSILTACQSKSVFFIQSMSITCTAVAKDIPQDLFIHLKCALENGCRIVYTNTELLIAVTFDEFVSVLAYSSHSLSSSSNKRSRVSQMEGVLTYSCQKGLVLVLPHMD